MRVAVPVRARPIAILLVGVIALVACGEPPPPDLSGSRPVTFETRDGVTLEGRLFGDVPMNLELRLSVEDSPNSAGVAIDAIRCAKLALERGVAGALDGPCSAFMKHPPRQVTDEDAHREVEAFIAGA